MRYSDSQAAHAKLDKIYTGTHEASGFKFKYSDQYGLYPDVYDYLLERADTVRIIHLYRQNLLKAAISKQNQLRLKRMGKPANLGEHNYIDLGKITLDLDQAFKYMDHRQKLDSRYSEEIKRFEHKYVLAYEDLLENTPLIMKDVFSLSPNYHQSGETQTNSAQLGTAN